MAIAQPTKNPTRGRYPATPSKTSTMLPTVVDTLRVCVRVNLRHDPPSVDHRVRIDSAHDWEVIDVQRNRVAPPDATERADDEHSRAPVARSDEATTQQVRDLESLESSRGLYNVLVLPPEEGHFMTDSTRS